MKILTGNGLVVTLTVPELSIGYAAMKDGGPLPDVALIGSLDTMSLFRYADAHHEAHDSARSFRGVPMGGARDDRRQEEYAVWLLCMMRGAQLSGRPSTTQSIQTWEFDLMKTIELADPYGGHSQIRLGRMRLS